MTNTFATWLEPVVGGHEGAEHPVIAPIVLIVLSHVLVFAGAGLAWLRYGRGDVPQTAPAGNLLTEAARKDLYQDDINEAVLMWPGIKLVRSVVWSDNYGVDGAFAGLATLTRASSESLRRVQNGFARSYALTMLAGVVAVLGTLWVMN